ncbi:MULTISPECIES: isochorismate synthase [unclassified Streptomyces]|uniref:isochorismate synthase n=1 Tax=unclassified Streptomyces TaxID=2593676 RepID=UPI000DB9A24D|nr:MULTISPECIES: isochorismate synthase [unclassified Streptomyces]MYT75684.1 isochorismate synthase [Streptomyces sp. SID8367]RAJ87092.1 isochorismate synthase [Streptomyces sp. PsTaAH-137]
MTTTVHEPATTPELVTPGTATALLDEYRPATDRLIATPHQTFLGHGTLAELPHSTAPLTTRVQDLLDEARRRTGERRPMVLGAIPFAPGAPPALAVPERVRTAPALKSDPLIALPVPVAGNAADWQVREIPAPEEYSAAVATAVARMRAGEFDKVVLARTLELTAPHAPDLPTMLRRLARRDPSGYTFAVPTAPGRTLIGASPELLVARRGPRLTANPLAGSAPRSADLAEDVRRAAALLESPKDLHEHAVVVAAVREALAPFCRTIDVPERPTLVRTAAMWHLSTTVTGELADPDGTTALDLACALHPTPAVCGTPTDLARQVIAESEPFDRGAYTGMVGWQNADGDGDWVVTIRCAEAEGNRLRLFAGAGVVAASSPEAETAETGAKFRTFLNAVGAAL